MSYWKDIFLRNTADTRINPSTEDKQDTQISGIGEPQETPSNTYSLLGRIKNLFTEGLAKVKIWNGTNTVTTTNDGVKERLDVAATLVTATTSLPLNVKYEKSFSAINANEWQEISSYVVPTGYDFSVTSFRCYSETAGETSRVFIEKSGGTFDCPTNTFTDGDSFTLPQFGSGLYAKVTTGIGSGSNDTITITYTNELGITGRTCTIVLPKNSNVGTSIEGVLQGDDLGVRDITNITHSATGQAGAFKIDIYYSVFNLLMTVSNNMYQAVSIAGSPIIFLSGEEIVISVLAGTKTSYIRHLSLVGTLVPA